MKKKIAWRFFLFSPDSAEVLFLSCFCVCFLPLLCLTLWLENGKKMRSLLPTDPPNLIFEVIIVVIVFHLHSVRKHRRHLDVDSNCEMLLILADRVGTWYSMPKCQNVPPDGCRKGPPRLAWLSLLSAAAAAAATATATGVGILLCTRAFRFQNTTVLRHVSRPMSKKCRADALAQALTHMHALKKAPQNIILLF